MGRFEVTQKQWRELMGTSPSKFKGDDLPVEQISREDAQKFIEKLSVKTGHAYRLPSEAEWEFAARGGLEEKEFAWGDELTPDGKHRANTWQGMFPTENLRQDGYDRTSPVRAFPPNGYGIYDMIGNTWEWTQDWYFPRHPANEEKACCIPKNPRGAQESQSLDPSQPNVTIPRKVLKGGSHLCAPNYCRRYRPAARHPEAVDTSTSHVGFRCVLRK
jgi:formylglycine-generating enzyme required for sulfatase activity